MPVNEAAGGADDRSDLALIADIARAAADFARPLQSAPFESRQKDDGTPVTDVDIAVDDFLKERLMAARPDYGWLSEESAAAPAGSSNRTFIIDPIDGTRAFINGRDSWTICIAVLAANDVRAGAIARPVRDEIYTTSAGGGAFLNGGAIGVSDHGTLGGSRLAGGQGVYALAPAFSRVKPPAAFIGATSMALRLCLVASGACDATVALSAKSDWDLAAGLLLVHEAGGLVSGRTGAPLVMGKNQRHEAVIAANPRLHAELVATLARIGHTP